MDGSTWQQGELGFHPGQSGGGTDPSMAILTFTSPITGFANIIFDIEMGLNGNISWFIDQNTDAGNLASGSMSSISETASFSIADLWVNKNDNLNFIVASNGNPGSDLVVIKQAQIELNAVPEPSSAMLVIFFLGTIGIYRYWSESLRLNSRLATTP
ncbi:hypothetical protein C5Y93_14475 [Blastopirellula marina]|uniref:PEP-CTERM protein-sorting domain-containing protein n=1 Tax=Blastopirellula marina TaxID=124 RepID=A0A2S8GMJ5_9BACT|nr:hypothetical protein C5Y93_14475 [Blastopirellula marina]